MPEPWAWRWDTALGPTRKTAHRGRCRSQWGHSAQCRLQQRAPHSTCCHSTGRAGAAPGTGRQGASAGVQCGPWWGDQRLHDGASGEPGTNGLWNRRRRGICCPAHNGNFPAHTLPWQLKIAFPFPPVFWSNPLRKPAAPGTAPPVPYCTPEASLCILIASRLPLSCLYSVNGFSCCHVICSSKACIMDVEDGIGGCHRQGVGSGVNGWWRS